MLVSLLHCKKKKTSYESDSFTPNHDVKTLKLKLKVSQNSLHILRVKSSVLEEHRDKTTQEVSALLQHDMKFSVLSNKKLRE